MAVRGATEAASLAHHNSQATTGGLLLGLDFQYLPALIVPALGTGAMRHFALVTVGAFRK